MDEDFFLGGGAGGFPAASASAGAGRSLKRRHPDSTRDGGGASGAARRVASASAAAALGSAAEAVEGVPVHRSKGKGGGFQSLGLSQPVLSGILRLGYKLPTPIQRRALPLALTGRDLVAMARTGSGKTAAFLIPMVERLVSGPRASQHGVRAVLLSPTRELALQTLKFATKLAKFTDLKCTSLVGGESLGAQFAALANHPDVLVATPGRLMHLLREVPGFHLRAVQFVCFDEADRLFELGFAEQLREILARVPEQRQTLLFSATLPSALIAFAKAGLRDPQLVRLDVETKVSGDLGLAFFTSKREEKPAALLWVLRNLVPSDQQAIVFVATRHHSEFIATLLQRCDIPCFCVYGSQDMETRKGNLEAFRHRTVRVLVVTDVAARGLDIPLLDNVINYDFPDKAKLFVHRVGRVARQGRSGCAFSLVTSSDLPYMLDFMLFLGFPASNVYRRDGVVVSAVEDAGEGEGEEGSGSSGSEREE
jgi:ATP-dependent RNA helicase DDX54/DBP10